MDVVASISVTTDNYGYDFNLPTAETDMTLTLTQLPAHYLQLPALKVETLEGSFGSGFSPVDANIIIFFPFCRFRLRQPQVGIGVDWTIKMPEAQVRFGFGT